MWETVAAYATLTFAFVVMICLPDLIEALIARIHPEHRKQNPTTQAHQEETDKPTTD